MCRCEQRGLTAVTGACGGGVGAGTWCTGFGQGASKAAVEARLTLLTVGSLGVALTIQTHSCRTEQSSHDYMAFLELHASVKRKCEMWLYNSHYLFINPRLATAKPSHHNPLNLTSS